MARSRHLSRQLGNRLRLADPHQLALAEHLQPRRIARRFVAENQGRTRIDAKSASRHRSALRDGRIDRVASSRSQNEIGLRLMRPRTVLSRNRSELSGIAFAPFESAHACAEMRERVQIAGIFERLLRKHGRELHLLRMVVRRTAADQLLHPFPDSDVDVVEPVDARYAALDHEPR